MIQSILTGPPRNKSTYLPTQRQLLAGGWCSGWVTKATEPIEPLKNGITKDPEGWLRLRMSTNIQWHMQNEMVCFHIFVRF